MSRNEFVTQANIHDKVFFRCIFLSAVEMIGGCLLQRPSQIELLVQKTGKKRNHDLCHSGYTRIFNNLCIEYFQCLKCNQHVNEETSFLRQKLERE